MKNLSKKKLIWLIIATVIVIVEIKAFTDSRADKLLEINTNIVDASGLLDVEKIKLEASSQNEAGYYVVLPEYINGKKASKYYIEEKSIINEDEDSSEYENYIENNQETEPVNESENGTEYSPETQDNIEEQENNNEDQNQTQDNETVENTEMEESSKTEEITNENEQIENENTEETQDNKSKIDIQKIIQNSVEKAPGEKVFLTNEELKGKETSLIVEYIKSENSDGSIFYYKHIEKTVENNNIIIEGNMPVDSEVKAEVVQKDNINELVDEYASKEATVKTVIDIKIISQGNEYEPSDFGENVKVYITNLGDINKETQKYKVVHIKDDETTEEVKQVETKDDSVEFTTDEFSEYAIILDSINPTPENSTSGGENSRSITLDNENPEITELLRAPAIPTGVGNTFYDEPDEWDGTVATSFKYGNGSLSSPYLITTGAELAYLAQRVNAGTTYAGQVFQLARDIDLKNRNWTPIGTTANSFRGIFNGAGRTIKNANVSVAATNYTSSGIFYSFGFFGSLGGGSTYAIVENTVFDNINVTLTTTGNTANSSTARGISIGIVTGSMYNHSEVNNVVVRNSNLSSSGSIRIRNRNHRFFAGGIAGEAINARSSSSDIGTFTDPGAGARYIINNCYVDADINLNVGAYNSTNTYLAQAQCGGIIGSIRRQAAWPEYCLYTGTIKFGGYNTGILTRTYTCGFVGPIFGGRMNLTINNNAETVANNTNDYISYWNGSQADAGTLTMTSYYTNFTVRYNDTNYNFTSTNTSNATNNNSTNYVNSNYMGRVQGMNKGIYTNNISSLLSGFNSRTSDSVSWKYENGNLTLIPRHTAPITETNANEFTANISDPYNTGTYTYTWYNEGVQDTTNTSNIYNCTPSYTNDQNITLITYDGQYYAIIEFIVEKLYIKIEFDIDSPTTGTVTARLVGNALPFINIDEDYTFTWYKEDVSGESEEISGATGLVLSGLEKYYDYRLVATNNNISSLSDEKTFTYGDRIVVFCDYQDGSNYNNGWTPNTAVETLEKAYEKLDSSGSRNKNIIVLMGNYSGTEFIATKGSTTYAKNATITGKYSGTDYNASLRMGGNASATYYRFLEGDLTLQYMTLNGGGSSNQNYLCLEGFSFTVGESVTMSNYGGANSNQGLLGNRAPAFHVFAGYHQYNQANLPRNNAEVIIKSGTYGRVVLGGTPGTSAGQGQTISHDFLGTEANPYKVTLTVNIKNSTTSSSYDYDINLLTGGSGTGNNYSNVTENIISGKVGRVLGASIGDSQSKPQNWNYPCNTFLGTTTININGGTISELYGGCLGRNMGVTSESSTGNTCDSYFYGTATINITGGTIQNNIYGAGAGGVSGYDENSSDSYKSYGVKYPTSVNLNISGGTINGNIYGGGYGYTEYLNQNTTADDGGFLYGNSNIIISGNPTISGNIYGAGCGYESYSDRANLAGMKGNSYIEISGTPTITGTIYGAGAGFASCPDMAKLTGNSTIKINANLSSEVYGGGQNAKTTGNPTINIVQGSHTNTIYGGGNQGTVTGTTTVNISGGTNTNVYGGGNQATVTDSIVNVTGGTNTQVFGGGNNATVGTTTVTVAGGTTTTLFGGGNQAQVTTTEVRLNSGTVTTLYGGGNQAAVTTTNVYLTGGINGTTYGGGNQAGADTTNVTCSGTTFTNVIDNVNKATVFGGSNTSGTVTSSNVTFNSGNLPYLFGGNNAGGTVTTSNVTINNGTVTNAYGGNNAGGTTTTANLTINNGTITNAFGGGDKALTTTTYVTTNNGTITNVYGGGNEANIGESFVTLNGGTITYAFGGGNKAGGTTTHVTGNGATVTNSMFGGSNTSGNITTSNVELKKGTVLTVYGGNNLGGKTTTANVTISRTLVDAGQEGEEDDVYEYGTVTDVYGGGNQAKTNATHVNVNSQVLHDVFGGGNQAGVNTNTNVSLSNATIGNNLYGGGNQGTVTGNTSVRIYNSKIVGQTTNPPIRNTGNVYAGGNGASAIVYGNTSLIMHGTKNSVTKNVFGGGNSAATGDEEVNTSSSTVNIVGGSIGGNVYGGANTSVIYGTANVRIGYDAVNNNSLERGDIQIVGTVFGGGEANEEGSETYDFDAISVTQGINITIDGNGHNVLDMTGSIFGSGNASSSAGDSIITIKNYGTNAYPHDNISIQRAKLVTIDHSALSLSGTTDRTNEYSNVQFSLSRIDQLKLKNNSTLYLSAGANLLKEIDSLVDVNGVETKGRVTINAETGENTKNVDNRIYMLEGKNLNIATNEQSSTYGLVQGMFFFGQFTSSLSPSTSTGLYSQSYSNNDLITNEGTFILNSYVKGRHHDSHDLSVDGFYTNTKYKIDEEDEEEIPKIRVKYVEASPPDDVYYIWLVGVSVNVTILEMDLTASRYATLGTYELTLEGFSDQNSKFALNGFSAGLRNGVSLVDPSTIEAIELDETVANSHFGLSMKTGNTGWATVGNTTFTAQNGSSTSEGTKTYKKDNSTFTPTLNFCFYHSQNLTVQQNLGQVTISFEVQTPIDDLNYDVSYLHIIVSLSTALFQDNYYDGAITPGQQFGLFTSTDTTITSKSTFSTYYSLVVPSAMADITIIGTEEDPEAVITQPSKLRNYSTFKRALVSRNGNDEPLSLPVNTKITMLDMVTNKYYYYIVTSNDVQQSKYIYYLSDFTAMGSTDGGYDETAANATYYNSTNDIIYENFIFHVSFADSSNVQTMENNSLLMELQDSDSQTIVSVLGIQRDVIRYTVYDDENALLHTTGTLSPSTLYLGNVLNINATTQFEQTIVDSKSVYDTQFFDEKLGIKISIYDNNGRRLNSDSLFGVNFELNNHRYYPRIDGTTRINIADRVTDVLSRIKMHTENNTTLATGNYVIRIETFGSSDGIYYGLEASHVLDLNVTIINSAYGLKVTTPDEHKIIDKATGKNKSGNNNLTCTINYSSGLSEPKITVELYRRDYTEEHSQTYTAVDLADYVTDTLSEPVATNEYLLTDSPTATITHQMHLKDDLVSGTYKITYKLYDGTNVVGEAYEYIVIK